MTYPLRICVVSPFLDKKHGTERCVIEQIERLARDYGCEVVIYSQEVRDLGLSAEEQRCSQGKIRWRKIPTMRGPQLVRYIWFFVLNHIVRWIDLRTGRFVPNVIYSPGINCFDAHVISVHIVFAEFHKRVRKELALLRNPLTSWPLLLHRKIYYRLAIAMEKLVYRTDGISLAVVSKKVSEDLRHSYKRADDVTVIYHGIDKKQFNPEVRISLRENARRSLALPDTAYALLLVGNDWKKKGLATILRAMLKLQNPSIFALVVGQDDRTPYLELLRSQNLGRQISFLPPRADVEWYYAAADAYVGPSLEDAFAIPPLEAMACGIPTIVSRQAGVCEVLTHGVDGFIIEEPTDSDQLALLVAKLISEPAFSQTMGINAARTACRYTWDENAESLFKLLLRMRRSSA